MKTLLTEKLKHIKSQTETFDKRTCFNCYKTYHVPESNAKNKERCCSDVCEQLYLIKNRKPKQPSEK